MSITRLGLGGYVERKKPEKLFEPPPIDFLTEPTPASITFTDVDSSPTANPTDVQGDGDTIFTDVIPTSNEDAE